MIEGRSLASMILVVYRIKQKKRARFLLNRPYVLFLPPVLIALEFVHRAFFYFGDVMRRDGLCLISLG